MEYPLANFQILFESVPGLYLILSPDYTIVAASDAYLQATMTQRDQIIGQNLFTIFPDNPDDPYATGTMNLRLSLHYVQEHRKPHTMAVQKYDIRKPDGTFEVRYWSPLNKPVIDDNGNLLYIIHCVEDVTEFLRMKGEEEKQAAATKLLHDKNVKMEFEIYRRAQDIQEVNKNLLQEIADRRIVEEKLRSAQILLQATIESHKDILIFSVDRRYKYLTYNKAFKTATFHAYGTEVALGGSLLDSVTKESDRAKIKLNCDRALGGEGHVTIEEYGDVKRFYFETRYDPIINDNGIVTGITVLSTNVTERKVSEEKIIALNKELDSFTYSVAHDLRAPLRVIDGYTQMLIEDHSKMLDGEGKRLLNVISGNARQMGQLIDDLLNFSRLGKLSIKRQHVNMHGLLQTVIEEQLAMVERERINFKIATLEPLHCDGNLIKHVFSNLISNAIKYSKYKERSVIEIGSERRQNDVVYFIRDNGSGFDMQYVDKLFGVFQRLHKMTEYEGTGVGLAIVQRIVVMHGGHVWAEGQPDKGAVFYFSIPAVEEAVQLQ